jgi:hypothetical protein
MSVSILSAPHCVALINDAGERLLDWRDEAGRRWASVPYAALVSATTQPLAVLLLPDSSALVSTDSSASTFVVHPDGRVRRVALSARPSGVDGSLWIEAGDKALLEFWAASSRFAKASGWPEHLPLAFRYSSASTGVTPERSIGALPYHPDDAARPLLSRGQPFVWHDTVFFASRVSASLQPVYPASDSVVRLPVTFRGPGVVYATGAFKGEAYSADELLAATPLSDSILLVGLAEPDGSLGKGTVVKTLIGVSRRGEVIGRVVGDRGGIPLLAGIRSDRDAAIAIQVNESGVPSGVDILALAGSGCAF